MKEVWRDIYKIYTGKIYQSLRGLKDDVDALIKDRKTRIDSTVRLLKERESDWSTDYRRNYWFEHDYYAEDKKKLEGIRNKWSPGLAAPLDCLYRLINEYFRMPVTEEFARKLTTIKAIGMPLLDSEFDMLKEEVSSYMEARLFNHLAWSRTKADYVMTPGKEAPEKKELPDPYKNDIPLVTSDQIIQSYNNYKASSLGMLDYIGQERELLYLIRPKGDSDFRFGEYHPNPSRYQKDLYYIGLDSFFTKDATKRLTDSLDRCFGAIPSDSAGELTEMEKLLIKSVVSDEDYQKNDWGARWKIKQIAEGDPSFARIAAKDPRFKSTIEEMTRARIEEGANEKG